MERQKGCGPFGRTSGRPQGEGQRSESNLSPDKKATGHPDANKSGTQEPGINGQIQMGRCGEADHCARVLPVVIYVSFLVMLLSAGICLAQDRERSSIGATDDCTKILLNFKDSPNLTRQEKAELMDQALLDSLNMYDRCQNAHSRHSSAGGGSGSHGGDAGKGQQASSTASSGMTGANTPVDKQSPTGSQAGGADDAPVNKDVHGRTKAMHALSNGKIPDDIPAADNDSVLEEQIRQAAINETDPVIKEKLWNEYRKYKGLPIAKNHRRINRKL